MTVVQIVFQISYLGLLMFQTQLNDLCVEVLGEFCSVYQSPCRWDVVARDVVARDVVARPPNERCFFLYFEHRV